MVQQIQAAIEPLNDALVGMTGFVEGSFELALGRWEEVDGTEAPP
jgi:hypothetical protein